MICKKWTDGELVLSVETEDKFWKALPLGLPIGVGEWTHRVALTNSSVLLCKIWKFSR